MSSNKTLMELLSQDVISAGDVRYMNQATKEEIFKKTPNCQGQIRERIYWLQNSISSYPTCSTCGKELLSKQFSLNVRGGGYPKTCCTKCAKLNPDSILKTKKTNLKKYGAEHYLSSKNAREKIESTNLSKYGAKTPAPWSSKEFKVLMLNKHGVESARHIEQSQLQTVKSLIAKNTSSGKTLKSIQKCEINNDVKCLNSEKALNFNRDKLQNVELSWEHNECRTVFRSAIKNGLIDNCPKCKVGVSLLELSLRSMILDLVKQEDVKFNVKNILSGGKELDIFIPSKQLAIEFNGIYWHSTYKNNDSMKHLSKTIECESKGIKLIHIWEHDFIKKPDVIKRMLKSEFGDEEKINEIEIKLTESKTAETFLNVNHLRGFVDSTVNYGAFINNELISVMSFLENETNWEIVRYATIKCNKLITKSIFDKFVNFHNPSSIIAFEDKCFNTDIYSSIGMKEINETKPTTFWANTYSSDFPSNKSEDELKKLGWFKLWNCGFKQYSSLVNQNSKTVIN